MDPGESVMSSGKCEPEPDCSLSINTPDKMCFRSKGTHNLAFRKMDWSRGAAKSLVLGGRRLI
eukprot:6233317-Karenia_brevis.AAC.1